MLEEFKKFALKGNVVDLAIGVIIGTAFGKIVSSLVDDILMPPFGIVLGRVDFTDLKFQVGTASINYGTFINTVVNFLIVSFVIFLVVKQMNRSRSESEKPPEQKICPYCQSLVAVKAIRCPQCTSQLEKDKEKN